MACFVLPKLKLTECYNVYLCQKAFPDYKSAKNSAGFNSSTLYYKRQSTHFFHISKDFVGLYSRAISNRCKSLDLVNFSRYYSWGREYYKTSFYNYSSFFKWSSDGSNP